MSGESGGSIASASADTEPVRSEVITTQDACHSGTCATPVGHVDDQSENLVAIQLHCAAGSTDGSSRFPDPVALGWLYGSLESVLRVSVRRHGLEPALGCALSWIGCVDPRSLFALLVHVYHYTVLLKHNPVGLRPPALPPGSWRMRDALE